MGHNLLEYNRMNPADGRYTHMKRKRRYKIALQ